MLRRRDVLLAGAAGMLGACLPRAAKSANRRTIVQRVTAQRSRDGAGVSLRRALGNGALAMLDPFLLLDEMHSQDPADYVAGFPRHPHRGFETVSYVLRGAFEHRDSVGNHGVIADGGAQWMTAGRGIVHAEMPHATANTEELWGLQLWVNLPAASKWIAPRYQDLGAATIPEVAIGDARVRVVAGAVGDTRGPVDGIVTRPTFLDVALEPGAKLEHALPGGDTAFVYVIAGEVTFDTTTLAAGELGVTSTGTSLAAAAAATATSGGRFLLIAGTPIREPVARRGPFVMTTDAEIEQAFADYQSGRLAG